MQGKMILSLVLGAGLGVSTLAVADSSFTTLEDVSAAAMTTEQMDAVEGKNHVIRLVEQQTGKPMPTAAAEEATHAAGSIGAVGKDRPAIVKLLD